MTGRRGRIVRKSLAGVAVAGFALAALAAPALAETPTLTSITPVSGGAETVSGGGCAARASVQIQLDGVVLVTTRATVTGRYRTRVIIPVSVKPGSHRITVVCARPGGATTGESTDVTVALPTTGSAATRDAVGASALVVLGGVLVLGSRARRRVRTS